jgi:hypothetical protein
MKELAKKKKKEEKLRAKLEKKMRLNQSPELAPGDVVSNINVEQGE